MHHFRFIKVNQSMREFTNMNFPTTFDEIKKTENIKYHLLKKFKVIARGMLLITINNNYVHLHIVNLTVNNANERHLDS